MEALEMAQESLVVPACGTQSEGTKKSLPRFSVPRASREGEKKVFISNRHPQDLLGKDGPGFRYSPKRQMHAPQWGFGTAPQRPPISRAKYPETSNDLIRTCPDSNVFKPALKNTTIGIASRDSRTVQPDFIGFPLGEASPGPQRYHSERAPPCFRHAHAPKVDEVQPKYTMRPRTKIYELEAQTPAKVGPGKYPVPEACAPQAASTRPSLPHWSLMKTDRFVEPARRRDTGRLWDGMGNKKIEYSRTLSSPPSFSFGTSTRGHAQKVQPLHTSLDKGPAAVMAKHRSSHPQLPPRREVIKHS